MASPTGLRWCAALLLGCTSLLPLGLRDFFCQRLLCLADFSLFHFLQPVLLLLTSSVFLSVFPLLESQLGKLKQK